MKKLTSIGSFILSLLLIFSIVVFGISKFMGDVMLNEKFYKEAVDSGSYYELLKDEIHRGFDHYSMVTSIPKETFVDSIEDGDLRYLTEESIDSAAGYIKGESDYKEVHLREDIFTDELEDFLQGYAKENEVEIDQKLKNQITAVKKEAANMVESHGVLLKLDSVIKYSQFQKFKEALHTLYSNEMNIMILIIVSAAAMIFINRNKKFDSLLWIGGSLTASSLIILVPAIMGKVSRIAYKVGFANEYLKDGIRSIVLGYISYFLWFGSIMMVVGVITLGLYDHFNKKI